MEKHVFLSSEKLNLISQRNEIREVLQEVESRRSSSFATPKIVKYLAEEVQVNSPANVLKKIKEIALVLKKHLDFSIERAGLKPSDADIESAEIYPIYEHWERACLYDYIGGDNTLLEFVEGVKYNFFTDAALLLKKKLEKLESRLRYITREYNRLIVDKRAYFRSIVKLMFKNMDDEHFAVNNSNHFNYLGYLHMTVHYGIRTYQKTAGGFNRASITG